MALLLVKKIGRYELPILSILLIKQARTWRAWLGRKIRLQNLKILSPEYEVIMNNGQRLRFTEEEKRQYDEACQHHLETMRVYGMCKGLGRVGM